MGFPTPGYSVPPVESCCPNLWAFFIHVKVVTSDPLAHPTPLPVLPVFQETDTSEGTPAPLQPPVSPGSGDDQGRRHQTPAPDSRLLAPERRLEKVRALAGTGAEYQLADVPRVLLRSPDGTGPHYIQVANWYLGEKPEMAVGSGGINHWQDGREVYDNVHVAHRYPCGVHLFYDSMISNRKHGLEVQIPGSSG